MLEVWACIDVHGQYIHYRGTFFIHCTCHIALQISISSILRVCSYSHVSTGNDVEEFTISNTGGSAIRGCTSGLRSSVVFQCDPNARWEELQEGNITHHIRSIEHDAAKCMVCWYYYYYISSTYCIYIIFLYLLVLGNNRYF